MLQFQINKFKISKKIENNCECSQRLCLQPLKISGSNSKCTLSNKKQIQMWIVKILLLSCCDTIHIYHFCFSKSISNFNLIFLGVVVTYIVNIHKKLETFKFVFSKFVSWEHLMCGITWYFPTSIHPLFIQCLFLCTLSQSAFCLLLIIQTLNFYKTPLAHVEIKFSWDA